MRLCARCAKPLDHASWKCAFCSYEPPRLNGHPAFAIDLAEENEGFEADYFERLARLEANNFWFRSRSRLIFWALKHYFPEAKNFFEVGCGSGFVLSGIRKAFPDVTASGSEVFRAGLVFAAERLAGVELFQMDARRIPFVEEFDVIGAFDVLEHIREDEEALSQMYQATRKGGGLLLTVPHHPFLWSRVDSFARHVRRYRTSELREKVERAGFSVVRLTSFVTLLLPPLILSRFKQKLDHQEFDPSSEFVIGSLMNKALETILQAEQIVIRAGLSLPAGGSLLLVARRS